MGNKKRKHESSSEEEDSEDSRDESSEETQEEEEEEDEVQEFLPKYMKKAKMNQIIKSYTKNGYVMTTYIETKKNKEKGYLVTFVKK